MDVLSDVLQTVHLRSAVYFHGELTAPWGIRVEKQENSGDAGFLLVTRGSCYLEHESPLSLTAGDLVVFLRSNAVTLRDNPHSPVVRIEELVRPYPPKNHVRVKYGGGGALTTVVGGAFQFENQPMNPLLLALPPLIHIRGENGEVVWWLGVTLKLIASETASDLPGAQVTLARLTDILFIQMVRAYVASLPSHSRANRNDGWLRALLDPGIGKALGLIHERPEYSWTVAELASRVAMSRSAFFSRFTSLVGIPPLKYVTQWRMHKASALLREGRMSLAQIAALVGYESEAAFNKAFRREIGVPPGTYRRHVQALSQGSPQSVSSTRV